MFHHAENLCARHATVQAWLGLNADWRSHTIRGPRAEDGAAHTDVERQQHAVNVRWQMSHPLRTNQPRFGLWLLAALLMTSVAGCAGGSWLESRTDSGLPIDSPAHGYPTAIDPTSTHPPLVAQQSGAPTTSAVSHASTHDSAPTATPRVVTPLAVVPPEFRIHGPQSPPTIALPSPAEQVIAQSQSFSFPLPGPIDRAANVVPASGEAPSAANMPVAVESPPEAKPTTDQIEASSERKPSVSLESSPEEPAVRIERARGEFIAALEAEIRRRRSENLKDEALPKLEQDLRLAYLTAGRLDDAVSAVESLDGPQRGGFKHVMFGLGVWLSPDEARRAPLRTAKVLESFREATKELAATSKLTIPKLCFCERVDCFGSYSEFPRNEFQPKQQVILYTEIENFTAEHKLPAGYETELQGSYQIFDASGQIVAERELPLDKEVCRNLRHDYFLAYRIYLPDSISPGNYRLELTIEDLKARGKYLGRKLGEGMIEFAVRQ